MERRDRLRAALQLDRLAVDLSSRIRAPRRMPRRVARGHRVAHRARTHSSSSGDRSGRTHAELACAQRCSVIAWLLSRTSSMTVIQRRRYWIVVLIVHAAQESLKNPSGAGDLVVTRQQDAAQSAAAKRVARRSAGIAFDFTQSSMRRAVLLAAPERPRPPAKRAIIPA